MDLVLLTLVAAVVADHTTQVDAVDPKEGVADLVAAVMAAELDQKEHLLQEPMVQMVLVVAAAVEHPQGELDKTAVMAEMVL